MTSVVIGMFDGVHRGHQDMLAQAREIAGPDELVVATFDPHPRSIVRPPGPPLLASLEDRVQLVLEQHVDRVEVVPFTGAFSALSPVEFIEQWLIGRLHATRVIVGANFRFGHRAAGSVDTLREFSEQFGFTVHVVELRCDDGVAISSTRVRAAIADGDMPSAEQLLGRPHQLVGVVVHGAKRGRELGFPTANLSWPGHLAIPPDGVYAGYGHVAGGSWKAAISVGTNPQFTSDDPTAPRIVEVHLLDFDHPDIYDEVLRVDFTARVRGQAVFASLEALISQIQADVVEVRDVLRQYPLARSQRA